MKLFWEKYLKECDVPSKSKPPDARGTHERTNFVVKLVFAGHA
jgi:hypothetical protein